MLGYAAKIYAQSLYSVCGDALSEQVNCLLFAILKENDFFASNKFPIEAKLNTLQKVGLQKELYNFCAILFYNKRHAIFASALTAYLEVVKEKKGEVDIDVTSYINLDDDDKTQISNIMIEKYPKIKKVNVKSAIDKALLGGFVIKFDSRMIDFSVATRLNKLKSASIEALSVL